MTAVTMEQKDDATKDALDTTSGMKLYGDCSRLIFYSFSI